MHEEPIPKIDEGRSRLLERKLSSRPEDTAGALSSKLVPGAQQKETFKVMIKNALYRIQATTGESILLLYPLHDEDSDTACSDPSRIVM